MQILFKKTGLFFYFILLIFSVSGCVSAEKHETLENQYTLCQQDLTEAQEKTENLTREKETLIQEKEDIALKKDELEHVKDQMIEDLESEISDQSVRIQMLEENLQVTVVEKLFFESGSAEVKPEGKAVLDKIAETLKKSKNTEIHVIGHTDELPPKKYPSNWELSVNRATAIVQILQWGVGIDPKRMSAEGVAHYRPLVMETAKNRAMNRVVEISLTMMPGQ